MDARPAGFWLRLGAFWVDALVVFASTWLVVKVAYYCKQYLPFETTFLVLLITQTIVLTALLGGTIGKLLCGLHVVRMDGRPVQWIPTLIRETFGKLISLAPLSLGFLWIGWTSSKRGWHDHLAGTRIQQRPKLSIANQLTLAISFAALLAVIASLVVSWSSAIVLYRRMAPRQVLPLAFEERDPKTLVDVSTLTEVDHGRFLDWMNRQGSAPLDYVVGKAREHQVVVIGEIHEQRQLLEFLNELIPRLYHEAGVTRLAMECCPAARDTDLKHLVTADTFDRDLLLSIAREGGDGQPWGFQEYWDVLETVWKLNHSLSAEKPRMLVVGLGPEIDQPSLMMLADPHASWWERLRVARLPHELGTLVSSDAFYARQVEEQIIEPGLRGIVWVGYAHASLRAPNPWASDRYSYPRMGFMLHQKYGDQLFEIRMHAPMISIADVDPTQPAVRSRLRIFLDELFEERNNKPVGFDIVESPFGPLRDKTLWEDQMAPRMDFEDRSDGYVMLLRSDRLIKCRWIPNFITPEMFTQLKPYYQAIAHREGHSIENAGQFNTVFSKPSDSLPN
jgi:uncharacterized RDD family membrane protein YckC